MHGTPLHTCSVVELGRVDLQAQPAAPNSQWLFQTSVDETLLLLLLLLLVHKAVLGDQITITAVFGGLAC
jgi:hypothetical protein